MGFAGSERDAEGPVSLAATDARQRHLRMRRRRSRVEHSRQRLRTSGDQRLGLGFRRRKRVRIVERRQPPHEGLYRVVQPHLRRLAVDRVRIVHFNVGERHVERADQVGAVTRESLDLRDRQTPVQCGRTRNGRKLRLIDRVYIRTLLIGVADGLEGVSAEILA